MSARHDETGGVCGLTYVSRARPETLVDIDLSFRKILSDAQARNLAFGLTGALLACDGWFLQTLEGSKARVGEAFTRITRDKRHQGIRVLYRGAIPGRRFSGWSMCGRCMSPTDAAIVRILEDQTSFDPAALTPPRALALLGAVQRLQYGAPETQIVYL
jgi:Sensors of blue-light using FAD